MQFTEFSQANDVLRAAPGTEDYVQDLHIFRQLPYVVSSMTLDAEELAQVVATGQVFLQLDGGNGCPATAYQHAMERFAFATSFADAAQAAPMLAEFAGANVGNLLFMQPLEGQQLPTDSRPCAVACYQLTEAQVAEVSRTGQLYFKALGSTHAPICVHAANPITFSAPVEETPFSDVAAEKPLTDLSNQAN